MFRFHFPASGLIASGSLVTDDEVEERAGDEAHDGGEVERREDAQEDAGEESAGGGDDNDVDEHEEPAATVAAFSAHLAGRCFLPAAMCLSRRRCLSR